MSQTTNRESMSPIKIALVVALGLLFLVFAGRGCVWFGIDVFPGQRGWSLWWPVSGLLGLGAVIQIALAVWVGFDANRRGSNGWLWGGLTLFTGIVGLLVYLLAMQTLVPATGNGPAATERRTGCPSCSARVSADYNVCPYCATSLRSRCEGCGRNLEARWKVCPECGRPAGGEPDPTSGAP